MVELRVFELPTKDANVKDIEDHWCQLNTKLRNGERLDDVEINWMDTANTWLSST